MLKERILTLALAAAILLVLASCGGSKAKPPAPTLNLDYQAVKVFNFSWVDVEGETGYKLFEDEDGSGDFVEIASIPANAGSYQLEVFLPAKVNTRYKLAACNEAGCSESAEVAVTAERLVEAVGFLKASNVEEGDVFGRIVAISADGNTLAVGASEEDSSATGIDGNQNDNSAVGSGAVYVFVRDGRSWSQQAYIKASNTEEHDHFSYYLALSSDGNTLAVGAPYENSNATGIDGNQSDNSASSSGAVYVFARNGGSWSQQAYVKASNTEGGDLFGWSLALSGDGNTLAVGAPYEDSNATGIGGADNNWASSSGAVYVFVRDGASWSQQAYVKASNTEGDDLFGSSVALSGDGSTMVVSAPNEDSGATGIGGDQSDNTTDDNGAVYVFTRNGVNVWTQEAYVKASNPESFKWFGHSTTISADGNTMAVGASGDSSNATGIDGDQSDNSADGSGAVYVFVRDGASWSQQAYVKASNAEKYDYFGYSIALSAEGNTLAVGAYFEDSSATGIDGNQNDNSADGSGAVYVFVRDGGSWSQQAYVKASNTGAGDEFGESVALSGDGGALAVGAYREDAAGSSNQNDGSASGSGAVYVY